LGARISGNYFGYDAAGIPSSPGSHWITITSDGLNGDIIGVDPSTSDLPNAINQRNYFAIPWIDSIGTQGAKTMIMGNWFGYDISGVPLNFAPTNSQTNIFIDIFNGMQLLIGTNNDGVGDSVESNWFAATTYKSINIQISSSATINGNHFGYGVAGQDTASWVAGRTSNYIVGSAGSVVNLGWSSPGVFSNYP